MRRAIRFIAAVMLGLCVLAAAAYTVFTAVMSIVWLNPLGVLVAVIGAIVTIGLVRLTKRIAESLNI